MLSRNSTWCIKHFQSRAVVDALCASPCLSVLVYLRLSKRSRRSHLSFGDFDQNRCTVFFFHNLLNLLMKTLKSHLHVNRGNTDLLCPLSPVLFVCVCVCLFACQSDNLHWAVHGVWPVCYCTRTVQPLDQRWSLLLGPRGQVQNQRPQQCHFHSQWTFEVNFIG